MGASPTSRPSFISGYSVIWYRVCFGSRRFVSSNLTTPTTYRRLRPRVHLGEGESVCTSRGLSSIRRAPALHAGGSRSETDRLHKTNHKLDVCWSARNVQLVEHSFSFGTKTRTALRARTSNTGGYFMTLSGRCKSRPTWAAPAGAGGELQIHLCEDRYLGSPQTFKT